MYSIMLDKVSKSYQTNNYVVKAVNQADFAADKGTSVAIIGPSGSGKSTLLNMMGLIIYPDFGRILINGEDVTNLPDTALCHFRNSYFGYVVQDFVTSAPPAPVFCMPCTRHGRCSAPCRKRNTPWLWQANC